MTKDLIGRATDLAMTHLGPRTDKVGNPMVAHSLRVASAVANAGHDDVYVAAALLHDVVEDTDATLDDLHAAGMPADVIVAVKLLTHTDGSPYHDYIARVATNPIAAVVKLYDIADNTTPDRLAVAKRPAKFDDARLILAAAGYTL